jgi:hypothetical protein
MKKADITKYLRATLVADKLDASSISKVRYK